MNLKNRIKEIASSLGFQGTVIGALQPMTVERVHYVDWLERGYAAGMEYMKRNPEFRTSPAGLYSGSRSAIIVSISYYTEKPPPPGRFFGKVARYAVGLDYHAVIRRKLRELRDALQKELGLTVTGKPFTDDVALYEQGFAARHGLGFAGKNTLIIGPKLAGSYNFVGELFVDVEIEADGPYQGTCGNCFRCGAACPTNAIVEPGYVNANLCISYLTIENKGGIPRELRSQLGDWVFGCDICQEVCPYNQRPPQTPWHEFHPENGAGHYLDLRALLKVSTQDEFFQKFSHTPLRRPKRRGLLRNTLAVLGNQIRAATGDVTEEDRNTLTSLLDELHMFALSEEDPMLREHAAWALGQGPKSISQGLLDDLIGKEAEPSIKMEMETTMIGCQLN